MKKILALILAALMIATLTACSDDKNENNNDLKDYLQQEEIVNHETIDGKTFYFEQVDSESVTITGYAGGDAKHVLKIPATLDKKTVVGISEKAFKDCNSITGIEFPATMTTIGRYAFANCALISSLTIPASITSIGESAFYGCTALATLDLSATTLTEIPTYAFGNCDALTSVSIPACVETVGQAAFYGCDALESVTFAEGVKTLKAQAFQNCTVLAQLKLAASIETIEGTYVFSGSNSLYLDGVDLTGCNEESAAYNYIHKVMQLTNAPAGAEEQA